MYENDLWIASGSRVHRVPIGNVSATPTVVTLSSGSVAGLGFDVSNERIYYRSGSQVVAARLDGTVLSGESFDASGAGLFVSALLCIFWEIVGSMNTNWLRCLSRIIPFADV